jgi:hypothetical protein
MTDNQIGWLCVVGLLVLVCFAVVDFFKDRADRQRQRRVVPKKVRRRGRLRPQGEDRPRPAVSARDMHRAFRVSAETESEVP